MPIATPPSRIRPLRELLRELELSVHSPALLDHEALTAFVIALLREFVASRKLGCVFGSNAVTQLGEPSVVLPDLRVDVEWFWRDPLPTVAKCLRSA